MIDDETESNSISCAVPIDQQPLVKLEQARAELDTLQELRRRQDECLFDYKSLLRAVRAFHHCRDLEQLSLILRAIIYERIACSGLWFFIYDQEEERFVLWFSYQHDAAQTGEYTLLPDTRYAFSLQPGILWQLFCRGEPFSVVDRDGGHRFADLFQRKGLDAIDASAWLPLVIENKPAGVIALGPREGGRAYDENAMEFLQTVGEQAAVALNSVTLYSRLNAEQEKLDRTIQNLSVLYEISGAISQIDNMKQLLLEILDKAIQRVGAQKGSIMLYIPEEDQLKLQVVRGLPDKLVEEAINSGEQQCRTFRPGEGIAGLVFQRGQYHISNNAAQDDKYLSSEKSYIETIACLPLISCDEAIGVLNITNKAGGGFDEEDIEILSAIANQAAMIIEKADLYQLAITDELTGLYVRRFFYRRLEEEFRRHKRYNNQFSLLMIDIDFFKRFNDTYGHAVGDEVLKGVARTLVAQCREIDVVSRHGGEEFVILMPETINQGAASAAERLRQAVEELQVEHGGEMLQVTISVGIHHTEEGLASGTELLQRADIALYQAKHQGRNRVISWEEGMAFPEKRE